MAAPAKLNYKVYQGSTFHEIFRWESSTKAYVPITQITKTAPVVITAPAHGLVPGWRARVTNVAGMKEINSATSDSYYTISEVTTDTVTINSVNAIAFTAYTSGGVLEYNEPVDLTGYTARMQIREKITSTEVIDTLTTETGEIIITPAENTIEIKLSATRTAAYTFNSAVYSLELVKAGVVIPFIAGSLALQREVTR